MHKKDKSKNLNIGSLNECNSNNINDNNKLVKSNNKKNKLTEKWREFEYIVKEIVTETLEKSDVIIIDNILTAAQKDRGVDISITVSNKLNTNVRLTIEAKLREAKTLGLKDFASSVLYFLFNDCDMHCIVTNVQFSPASTEMYNIINTDKNRRTNKLLRYFDSSALKNFFNNENDILSRLNKVEIDEKDKNKITINTLVNTLKLLWKDINNNKSKKNISDSNFNFIVRDINLYEKKSIKLELLDSCANRLKNQILDFIKNNETMVFLIESDLDTLHNELIDHIIEECKDKHIIEINMMNFKTFEFLYLEIFANIFGFNINNFLDVIRKNITDLSEYKNKFDDETYSFLEYLLKNKNVPAEEKKNELNMILKNVLKNRKEKTLIVFRNIQNGAPDIIRDIIPIIKSIDSKNVQIIIDYEKVYYYKNESNELSKIINDTIEMISIFRFNGNKTKIGYLNDLNKEIAKDYLNQLLPNRNEIFYNTIIKNYGFCAKNLLNISQSLSNINSFQELNMFIENNFITTPNIFNNNMEEKLMSLFFLMQGHVPIGLMDSFLENFILNDTSISVPTTNGLYDKYQQVFDIFNIKTNTKIIKTEYEYLWTYPIKLNVVYGDFIVELCVFLLNNVPFKILAEQDQKCIKELILYQLYINFQNASSNIVNKEKILECLKKVNLSTYTKAAESAIKICEKNLSNYLVMEIITRYLHATENSTHYILKNIAFEIKLLRLQLRYRKKSIKELLSNTEKLLDKINSTNLKDNDYKNKLIVEIRKFRYNLFTKILQYKNALSEINSALLIFENDYLLLHYHAICFKELYGWGKAAKSYNCAIKKFVDKTEEKYFLKACFHNNNAADLIKKNVEQALKHLRIAKKNAICTSDSELPLWIDIGILHYKLIKISMKQEKIPKKFYDDMREYRRISDYNAYYTDIARTYNIEGITYLYNNQIENAQLCFNKAFNFSTSDSFSFMQLIANTNFLLCTKQSSEFTNVWEFQKKVLLANREFIIQKLKNRTDIKCEPNFAIVICSIVVAQKYNLETDFDLLIKAYESIIPNFCFNTPILLEEQISQLFFYNGNVAIQF